MVICAAQKQQTLDLDSLVPSDATRCGLLCGGSGSGQLSATVAAYSPAYKECLSYSDFWEVYQAVFPEDTHQSVGKESGQTAHVERWNNTLRQRLARFVRKTLSFSKSERVHDLVLRFFIIHYNFSRSTSQ